MYLIIVICSLRIFKKGGAMQEFDPRLFENLTDFDEPIKAAIIAVLKAGSTIKKPASHDTTIKYDKGYEHAATTTKVDLEIQKQIIADLKHFNGVRFITEEKINDYQVSLIQDDNLASISEKGLIYGIDPIDGTAQFKDKLWEWSVSVGIMIDGIHSGGIIYAPEVRGGMFVAGEKNKGGFLAERNCTSIEQARISQTKINEGVILLGVDFVWLPKFDQFIHKVAESALCTKSVGSCALGLASVAAGKSLALIQPHQKSHDWFAGYPLVEEAGGKVQFYHYRDSHIIPMEKPDLLSYSPSKPNAAFIAG